MKLATRKVFIPRSRTRDRRPWMRSAVLSSTEQSVSLISPRLTVTLTIPGVDLGRFAEWCDQTVNGPFIATKDPATDKPLLVIIDADARPLRT